MKRIAVVLSGCGFQDGSEITESVSTLIALSESGVDYQIFAPNLSANSKNHKTGAPSEDRNILHESARIARGDILDLSELSESNFDAIVFPGGYGAALHLSNWAEQGANCSVNTTVANLIEAFHANQKPIGALCIAPTLVAKVLGSHGIELSIGNDEAIATEIEKTGAKHIECPVNDFVSDRANKIVTTPAYMYEAKPHEVFIGVRKAIHELVEMS